MDGHPLTNGTGIDPYPSGCLKGTVDGCEILRHRKGWLKPYKSWDVCHLSTGAGFAIIHCISPYWPGVPKL